MVVYKTGEQTIYYGRFICLTITGTKIQRILSKLQRLRTMRVAALLWPGIPSTLSDPFCSERKRNVSGVRTKTLSHCRTCVAYYLRCFASELPAGIVYIVVGISAFAGALLLCEIISRIPIIRWCVLGLKKEEKHV